MRSERRRTVIVGPAAGLAALVLMNAPAGAHPPAPPAAPAATAPAGAVSAEPSVRFLTNRPGRTIVPPDDADAFTFAIFGDRTGGPPEGVQVLAEAVRDVNLLAPDFVMTVGDLIEGYNVTRPWRRQMREFRSIMDRLDMPWYPVAGNHDVYWRGLGRPEREHEPDYERHFGPLWYAFEHKGCWFVVLYSDEGDPATGERTFSKPAAQTMSPEQKAWLRETLARTAEARHVFVFLHHPRWLGGQYGRDWEDVHAMLAAAGNVSAVFAGHIHRMRYDGPRDGIEYVTLATTGGHQAGTVPRAGYLHHYHVVTVRDDRIAMAGLPVGAALDVRALTGDVVRDADRLAALRPDLGGAIAFGPDGSVSEERRVTITNPARRRIDVTLMPATDDRRWRVEPDHAHAVVDAGGERTFFFRVARPEGALDEQFDPLAFGLRVEYLGPGFRIPVPQRRHAVDVDLEQIAPARPAGESVLHLPAAGACVAVPSAELDLPEGPFTLEGWLHADRFTPRNGLVAKTERSEYGLFVNGGVPSFSVFLGAGYVEAEAAEPVLRAGRWHHVAGVFDGREVRLYVDGVRVARRAGTGPRRRNELPLLVGADVDGKGRAVSGFAGRLDEIRLSRGARYEGERFTPRRRHAVDRDTVLLLAMDGRLGPWAYDGSGRGAHGRLRGGAAIGDE